VTAGLSEFQKNRRSAGSGRPPDFSVGSRWEMYRTGCFLNGKMKKISRAYTKFKRLAGWYGFQPKLGFMTGGVSN